MESDKTYCKVLIIDDEYIMRQGIKHMIEWEKEGYQIVGEASNGQEGLRMIEQLHPHIVLADIVMPVINGIEFTSIVRKRYPQIKIIILSSYDHFEYVKETLINGANDYVLKPSINPQMLLNILEKTVATIPNLCLKKDEELSIQEKISRLLSGYEIDISESSFKSAFPHSQFRLLCSNQSILCKGYRELENDIYSVLHTELDEQEDYVFKIVRVCEELCCVICNYRIKDEDKLNNIINQCIHKIKNYQPETFWILGEVFHLQSELVLHYQKIVNQLSMRFYYKGKLFIKEEDCTKIDQDKRFNYEKYVEYLKYFEFGNAMDLLEQYLIDSCNRYTDEYMLKNITKNMLYNFIIEWEKADSRNIVKKMVYFKKIDNCLYQEDFLEVIHEMVEEIKSKSNLLDTGENSQIREICKYIRIHYNENMELLNLSRQFNYNYNYLSTYFNQQMKEGFSGYLNGIRIEKACELLKTTQNSIAEISSMVGYSDHSYFCRVFRNLKGRTPSEWRRADVIE